MVQLLNKIKDSSSAFSSWLQNGCCSSCVAYLHVERKKSDGESISFIFPLWSEKHRVSQNSHITPCPSRVMVTSHGPVSMRRSTQSEHVAFLTSMVEASKGSGDENGFGVSSSMVSSGHFCEPRLTSSGVVVL